MTADPRALALKLLFDTYPLPSRRFPREADRVGLQGRDRALCRELLAGTIRMQRLLDAYWSPFSNRKKVDSVVVWTLRLALYQRFFLDRIPTHAAVDATLNASRPWLRGAVGFANAILRRVEKEVGDDVSGFQKAAVTHAAAGSELDGLAIGHSFPSRLAERWEAQVGRETMVARMKHANGPSPASLRVNDLRASRSQVMEALRSSGLAPEEGPLPQSILLAEGVGDPRSLPGFSEGHWSVQDLSAQEVLTLMGDPGVSRILDLCAAPGGKSFALFEASEGRAEITACDVSSRRLEPLIKDAGRLGHTIATQVVAEDGGNLPAGPWDWIVLDAPCSNTGVLGRRPEARWRFGQDGLAPTLNLQKNILQSATSLASPSTRFLWSTCSLEPEENGDQAQALAQAVGGTVTAEHHAEPDATRAGGYGAVIVP